MAARFWIGGGTNANWNASPTTNWAATSGGTVRVAAPTVSDDVTFDGAGVTGNSNSTISTTQSVLSLTFTSGYTQAVTLNGILTIAGNFTDNTAHTYVNNASLTISAASTITSGGKAWPNNVSFTGNNTKTLSGNWTISGILTISGATVLNSSTINLGGGLIAANLLSGTTLLNLTSGATWSGGSAVSNSLTLGSGTTVSGLVSYNTGTLTSGSGVTTTGSTLSMSGSGTYNTVGTIWNNISTTLTGATITLNSLLSVGGILSFFAIANLTFAGSAGFITATLTDPATSTATRTFVSGVTYTVTTALTIIQSRPSTTVLLNASTPGTQANLVLLGGATCNLRADMTDINANGGRPIITFNGILSNCLNVFNQTNVSYNPPASFNRGSRRLNLTNKNKSVIFQ